MAYYERHLPHWHPDGAWLFITWRLHGSMPLGISPRLTEAPGRQFLALDRLLDQAATGPTWLTDARVASAVCDVIRDADSQRQLCKLGAFVTMSNHVHVLLLPIEPVAKVTCWIKGVSARTANLILNRTGETFWQHESFDHWVRNGREYERILNYIEENPVRAGLVGCREQWAWSSATADKLKLVLPLQHR
jgi:putative transposase